MRYHDITKDDMKNGEGLRVVLWVSGCEHRCINCQNPLTWDPNDGLIFDSNAKDEIFEFLSKEYISGITFSGGDPLFPSNRNEIENLIKEIKDRFKNKTIWLYTGYKYETIKDLPMIKYIDVLLEGPYIEAEAIRNLRWVGSKNQRIIDIQKTINEGRICLYESNC